jgi:hypothetical protein
MNFSADGKTLTLKVRGLGTPSAFKNGKMMTPNGPITDPEKQKQMESITAQLRLQLLSARQTITAVTEMEHYRPSWIAWFEQCAQFDDSRKWIPDERVKWEEVPQGEEGFDLDITIL